MGKNKNLEKKEIFAKNAINMKARIFIIFSFVLTILSLSILAWAYFFYLPKIVNNPSFFKNTFSFLNPARKFVDKNNLIINFQPLRDYLNREYGQDKDVSLYFEFLNTGANIVINKDAEFWPASLPKVPTAMVVAKKIEDGKWKWSNELVMMPTDKDERFGDLYKNPIGTHFTVEKLVEKTLTESDNTANYILVRNLEPEEIEDVYSHLGFGNFFSKEGKVSAKKYSVIFRSLYNAAYLNDDNSQKLIEFMTKTPFKEYLSSGIPDDVAFSHKIGVSDEKNVFLDAGIVYAPGRPYILTVMINADDQALAEKKMKDISEKIYNYVSQYNSNNEND